MQLQQTRLSPDILERINREANTALNETFEAFIQQRRAARPDNPAGQKISEALLLNVFQDETLKKAYPKESLPPQEQILRLQAKEQWKLSRQLIESPTALALATKPMTMDNPLSPLTEDSHLQIFGPPYIDQWTSQNKSGNAQVNVSANKATGDFGYFIGSADGAASCGTGVWVQFVPTKNTKAQIRTYTPYNYQYDLDSQFGYTAHDNGGFGIFVLSWNLDGTNRFNDLDYRYTAWSDGTGWWDHHSNPSFPDPDFGYAYLYGQEAPYFSVQSDRVYLACIWGFGSSDAGGGYFGNAISASALNASVRFVVIGEQ